MNMELMPMIEWEKALDIQGGTQPPRSEFINHPQNGYIRLIQIRDFDSDKYKVYVPFTNKLKICQKEDIFIARYGASTGRILTGLQGAYNVALAKIIKKDKKIDNKFLYYFLQSYIFQNYLKRVSSRSAQSGFNKNDLASVAVPKPSLLEQQKIAAILSSIDEVISKTEKIVFQTLKIKERIMNQLLKRGVNQGKLKDTTIGSIPFEWTLYPLDSLAKVTGGKRLPKGHRLVDYDTGRPYIRVSDMNDDGIDDKNILFVPMDIATEISRYRIFSGDLYITVAGTLGKVGKVPQNLDGANLTENANRISDIQCNTEYLLYVLQSEIVQSYVAREQTNNAQPKLALTRIKKFLIPLPNEKEQEEIVNILNSIDDKITIETKKLEVLKRKKKGLMQQLLTGKVRVPLNENEEVPQ